MRQKRAKAYKKQMATYERNFGFRHPYQILFTADFLESAKGFHLDPISGVKRTVQGEIKTMITQCCIKELYDEKADSSIRLAKTMERRRCGHVETPETPYDCVVECVGKKNKNRYIVATNDQKLREQLRQVPGVPLVYINRSVMILEPPSPATLMIKETREAAKLGVSAEEAVVLGKRKRVTPTTTMTTTTATTGPVRREVSASAEDGEGDRSSDGDDGISRGAGESEAVQQKKKKRRGIPGPNPLSLKKAKVTVSPRTEKGRDKNQELVSVRTEAGEGEERSRRKRKHKKPRKEKDVVVTDDASL